MSRHGRGRDRGLGAILAGLGLGAISIGGAAAAVGASWKVAEALVKAKKLFHVRGENAVFVRLTDRVKVDLRELERLLALKEVKEALRHNKGKTYWLKEKVEDVKEAIDGMQKYTRKVANAGWWLGLRTRLWWVLDEYEKLIHREMELASAREGVLAAIEFLSQFEENPEHHHHKGGESRHTTVKKEVDIDVDVDENKRGRRVIELDVEGRPIRRPEPRYEEFVEEDIRYDEEERPFRVSARDGFYDGRLDGPLSTRPSWWAEKYGVQGSDEYIKRTVVEEKIETDVPLRVHWPTKL